MLPKLHIALNVNKFDQAVSFYSAFFGQQPVKHKPGYAKFDIETPGVNLTLNKANITTQGALNHLGIQVDSKEDLLRINDRLRERGLLTRDEMGTNCCFALQDKVWIDDPDGNSWEVFVVYVGDTAPELEVSKQSRETVGAGLQVVEMNCSPISGCKC
ncbi:MAG: VOC family protein [Blastocatellia bacterium]|nr:VOC family protein [Blastocatellia bacterium]